MQQPQVYDSSLKSLLEGLADQVLPEFVAGVEVEEELNDEMLKPPLRADLAVRHVFATNGYTIHSREMQSTGVSGYV